MAEHIFTDTLEIDRPLDEVFEFFADARNLEKITPNELGFNILSPIEELREGSLIDYSLRLYGFPIKWRTEITKWDPPNTFVDTQLSGPYSQWIHTHKFTEIDPERTLIEDAVRYRLPLEPLGDLAHFLVRQQICRIFAFRKKTVAEILEKTA
ncbi:MAG TPA: SRPBCC family protein [Pyrinomonadaceae bacterium]|nr:SRPBCC family protein [Pyrinomonadaceae bacterium]